MNVLASITPISRESVLQRVSRLLPEIEERAEEAERAQRVPADLLMKLEDAGAFRMSMPAQFGGEEMRHGEAARVIEEVAVADASIAWNIVAGSGVHVFTTTFPVETLREFYGRDPNIWAKASGTPKGVAIPVEGGYRMSGYWPLASGCRDFEWVCLGFTIKDQNGMRMMPNGMPDFRVCLIRRENVTIHETWDAVGFRATRSDDIECKDVFVPEAWQGRLFGKSNLSGPIYKIFVPLTGAAHHTAIVNGILRGALNDIATSALTRRPAFNPAALVKDDPIFQSRFGELASRVDAIMSLQKMCVDMIEVCTDEDRDATPYEMARIGSASSLLHHEATHVMDQLMLLSGSAGLYTKNRIQRRWRDLRCLAQHHAANTGTYNGYAKALTAQAAGQ